MRERLWELSAGSHVRSQQHCQMPSVHHLELQELGHWVERGQTPSHYEDYIPIDCAGRTQISKQRFYDAVLRWK